MAALAKLASGVAWGTVSGAAIAALQIVLMAVMARLLGPADFGLVVLANVSLRFFSCFAQMGVTPALITKTELDDGDLRAALGVSLSVSAGFFLLALALAGPVESFFVSPGLAWVTRALALNFLIGALAAVSSGLLRRQGRFRAIALIDMTAYAIGYGLVGLGLARFGGGAWALVAATLSQAVIGAALGYAAVRYPLGLEHRPAQRRHFLDYGGRYSLIGFVEFLASNLDSLLVGKLLGLAPAGLYNRAFLLANLPVQQPSNVLTTVLFPMMSAVGDQRLKQSVSFQLGSALVGAYAFAVGAGLWVAAPDVIAVLLGPKWAAATPVLQTLAWSVGPVYVSHVAGVTLDALGALVVKLRIQLSLLALLLGGLLIAALHQGTAVAIAQAVVVTEWVRLAVMVAVLVHLLAVPGRDVARLALCVAVPSAAAALCVLAARLLAGDAGLAVARLVFEVLGGALGLGTGVLGVRRLAARIDAVVFLAARLPRLARFLPLAA